jgi:hypothetical protein
MNILSLKFKEIGVIKSQKFSCVFCIFSEITRLFQVFFCIFPTLLDALLKKMQKKKRS